MSDEQETRLGPDEIDALLDEEPMIDNSAPMPPTPPKEMAGGGGAAVPSNARLDVILDIDLPLVVRFGRTEMQLKALTQLGPGSVIDLGRSPHEPVDVLVSGRVVARGEVVVVGGNYGIRILDVLSPTERMPGMEV